MAHQQTPSLNADMPYDIAFSATGPGGHGSISTTGAQKASSSSPSASVPHHHGGKHHNGQPESSSHSESQDGVCSSSDDGGVQSEEKSSSRLRDIPAISTTGAGGEGGLGVQGNFGRLGGTTGGGGPGTSTPFSPFSPIGSSSGFDTPQEIGSPNLSNKAFHGSIVNGLPFPRGMKHDLDREQTMQAGIGESSWDWEKMLAKLAPEAQAQAQAQTQAPPSDATESAQDCLIKESTMPVPIIEVHGDDGPADPLDKLEKAVKGPSNRDGDSSETSGSKLEALFRNDRVIAIDFDDVCSQNMAAIIKEHNVQYGTDLALDDLQTYVFWQNRGWGTPADVARKVMTLNHLLPRTAPIPGFASSLRHIHHTLGHPIHIITSRPASDREALLQWLRQEGITVGHGPEDVIAEAWFTGTYGDVNIDVGVKSDDQKFEDELNERLKNLWKDGVGKGKGGLGKLKILRQIDASLFIDDHHGNLEPILAASPPIPCLLFGKYGWNASRSGIASPVEMMDYEERTRAGLPLPREEIPFVMGIGTSQDEEDGSGAGVGVGGMLTRAEGWDDVIRWVEEWDRKAVEAVSGDT